MNPVPSYGLETALELAAARPDVQFAFVEWWKLDDDERAALERPTAGEAAERGAPPRDHRPRPRCTPTRASLLAPFLLDGRPRVVLEAQANGIPVLARDLPALRETVGHRRPFVRADAPVERLGRRARAS